MHTRCFVHIAGLTNSHSAITMRWLHWIPVSVRRAFQCCAPMKSVESNPNSPQAPQDDFSDEDFYRYTRLRFLMDGRHRMSERYVRFDLRELCRLAAKAVGSEECVKITKYPDGMSNKAFLMAMNDGKEVVAKIPTPIAGRPHFTTASEVATMDFVCRVSVQLQQHNADSARCVILLARLCLQYTRGVLMPARIKWVPSTSSWKKFLAFNFRTYGRR